ncbi:alpha/beta hydrolase [Polaromonas hydrogenivorans]|uniref:Alpha/beta fold hydrolase n=1 Tax=Polaromonas hydrogenivorans TaxID=335476 RepID=A0AAU7LNK0_9BURK
MKHWPILSTLLLTFAILAGCATLDEQQRGWIFQPSDRSWGGSAELARDMQNVWIGFDSTTTGRPVKLHGLWLPADKQQTGWNGAKAPLLLYLHGARWNVEGSAPRIRRMQELGFSVLAVDYRGFGKSSPDLPSENMAYEDAQAAWNWLGAHYPGQPRYIFGHSLGGAVAIELASRVHDEAGTIVEGTFTSIADVVSTMKWGWLPLSALITQPFESVQKVAHLGSPLLVVHGTKDTMILPSLGRKLYEAAQQPKAFVLVEGGSHFNTNTLGQAQYRVALADLFGARAAGTLVTQR